MEYKKKIHAIVIIGVLLVVMVYGYLGISREEDQIDAKVRYEEYQIAKTYELERSKMEDIYVTLLQATLTTPEFSSLFKRQDFQKIQTTLQPVFANLKLTEEHIQELNLYDMAGKLKIHLDHASAPYNRQNSVLDMERLQHNGSLITASGIFFAIRFPIEVAKQPQGFLELLVDIRHFTELFENILEAQSAVYITDPVDEKVAASLEAIHFKDGYLFYAGDGALSSLPASSNLAIDNQMLKIGKKHYNLHSEPALINPEGEKIGSFILLFDRTAEQDKLSAYIMLAILITSLLMGFIYFFSNVLLNRIVKKIDDKRRDITRLNQTLTEIAEEKTKELDKNMSLLQSYKRAVDNSNIVSKTDPKGIITYVNQEFIRVSGFSKDELIGQPHSIVRHPDMPAETFKELWATIRANRIWKGMIKNRKKDGGYYLVDSIIVPVTGKNGEINEYIAIRHDVTNLIRQQEELKEIKTDSLTKLANKNALKDRLSDGKEHLLAILSIDNYKEIKNFYGVDVMDGVVSTIAKKIESYFQRGGFETYKITSEQFALHASDMEVKKEMLQKIHYFIRESSNTPVNYNGYEVYLDFSAGIACDTEGSALFKNADLALKEARFRNIDLYIFDNEIELVKEFEKNIHWTAKLKKAIASNQLKTYFQPIVNNETGAFEKYESLIRMIDEDGSVITPFFFLDTAKRSKLYPHITQTIITQTVEVFKSNDREFSINITADDIHNDRTVDFLEQSLLENDLASRCVLEITESEEIKDYRRVVHFIKRFKGYGCKVAIDDFGSGYSNFSYIANLDADYIKIDGSLIKSIDKDPTSELIVKAIITFAKSMGIKTVAEFVSSKAIYEKIKAMGIDYSQGYYFAAPADSLAERV